MDQVSEDIKNNTKILLARNSPVALVVGAASFFGSHLVDKLLLKDIQVIGVDDLTWGKRDNLSEAVKSKNFHLVNDSAENLSLQLERLDYIFIIPQKGLRVGKLLDYFKQFKSRLLLVSSIELYDKEAMSEDLRELKKIEEDIAKKAQQHNLNARILRVGPIFGPRMSFDSLPDGRWLDPAVKLIQQSLSGDLQKDTSLEFSSRALFIDDAVNLAIKCILSGATAQKIFDGVLPTPIKVAEIKQILLDPVWYESRDFRPQELPPWSTPNLEKTIKFLSWQPGTRLVEGLRKTISFFKDNEIKVPKLEDKGWKIEDREEKTDRWQMEKAEELAGWRGEQERVSRQTKQVKQAKQAKFPFPLAKLSFLTAMVLIGYALIWPLIQLGWGTFSFRWGLTQAVDGLGKGEFDKSLREVRGAKDGVIVAKSIFYSLEPIRELGILKPQFELGDNLLALATLSADSAQNTILGMQNLISSLKSITGEITESPKDYFDLAQTYLAAADEDLSKADALIGSWDFKSNLPKILKSRVDNLSENLSLYADLVKQGRAVSYLLSEIVALEGKKDYLVLLQNNLELRPTGGFIGSFAKISFEGGKLKKLEVNDTSVIDGQLNLHVEPPKEIKEDLGQKDYFLRDSNWEPDFPTSAKQIEWFYNQETGERVAGVVALDTSAIEDLLSVLGELNLPDYEESVSVDNLFEKAISYEVDFPLETQVKKSFLTALSVSLFNKLFFLPNQNWPGIATSLGRSLDGKHLSIYFDDPRLFSYILSQNWAGVLPKAIETDTGLTADFLALVEANLGANKANYYLDRKYNLETVIGKDGEVSHKLRINYTNRSPSNVFPAGAYKNRMRVYLPFGTKLNRVLWGEGDITDQVSSFVDYGRVGFSYLLELSSKEQKTLVLDYQTPLKLVFKDHIARYRLDVVKQAGTLKDPFVWTTTFPINMSLAGEVAQKINPSQGSGAVSFREIGPQEYSIQTDLSKDRTFQMELRRP